MTGGDEEIRELLNAIRADSGSHEALIVNWDERSLQMSSEERTAAFSMMLVTDFWFWLPVVCRMLELEIGGPDFMPMIEELSRKVNENLAGEMFWSGLVDGAEKKPYEALVQANELLSEEKEVTAIFASALLGGAARSDPEKVLGVLREQFSSRAPSRRSAAMRTFNIALNEETLPGEDVLDIVLSHPIPKEDDLRSTYSMTLRLLHPFGPEPTESRLRELLRSSPSKIRMQVAYDISVLGEISEDTKLLLAEYLLDER
ncbi:MAG TPA: hypothetical protein VMW26_04185 [Methanomassiliicoccales archaeon]|nr:hypothetical protein [Methanomassiliicoccales archaeon]